MLGSDAFRVSIAERVARGSETPPLEVMPDLVAGALAQRNIDRAIKLLESEKDRGGFGVNEIFLLSYLYCLNGSVEKAESVGCRTTLLQLSRIGLPIGYGKNCKPISDSIPLRSANNFHA